MSGRIHLLETHGRSWEDVYEAFVSRTTQDWRVVRSKDLGEVRSQLEDRSQQHLVLIPDDGTQEAADVTAQLHATWPDVPLVVMSERGSVNTVARAIRAGASDFLVCGEYLGERVATLLGKLQGLFDVLERNRKLHEHNAQLSETIQARLKMVGQSPQMGELVDRIRRVADVPRPVLIVGERGTGKELVARAIHFAGRSPEKPIVTVNCAAFSDALLESELFGHEKGAFTGADVTRLGKFELADTGTLFLDEIGHMSLLFQQKILRVVEYGTFTRVGGTQERSSTARIIAATNCDLKQQIAEGEFLADLYDRLAFETIEVPPLRQRSGDIELLAHHFLSEFARETPAMGGKVLSKAALNELKKHSFPGNVRELKNLIERAAYRDTTNEITPADMGLLPSGMASDRGGTFYEQLHAFSHRLIVDALRDTQGNQAEAARRLGLSYHQFRYYHRKYVRT